MANNPPKLLVPENACGCHMHIYDNRFPRAPTAPSEPPVAPVEAYQNVQRQLGVTRAVVVQPSAYVFLHGEILKLSKPRFT